MSPGSLAILFPIAFSRTAFEQPKHNGRASRHNGNIQRMMGLAVRTWGVENRTRKSRFYSLRYITRRPCLLQGVKLALIHCKCRLPPLRQSRACMQYAFPLFLSFLSFLSFLLFLLFLSFLSFLLRGGVVERVERDAGSLRAVPAKREIANTTSACPPRSRAAAPPRNAAGFPAAFASAAPARAARRRRSAA